MDQSPAVAAPPHANPADTARGMALGLLGVTIFALTLPMTRLAVGDAGDPQLSPSFAAAGRAAAAGVLAAIYLMLARAPRPSRRVTAALVVSGLGTVLGFPLLLALALRRVEAVHASVVTGVLPLATAAVAAMVLRQRPSPAFWACAMAGCALVLGFAAWRGGGHLRSADALLVGSVLAAAVGYVAGARAATELPAPQVVSWVLVGALPLTLPAAAWSWPEHPVRAAAWAGFAYTAVFSMWLGFFAWYRALALGGVIRVSQVQLLQPFLALLFAVPLLGERLDAVTIVFALAVVATVFVGRRQAVDQAQRRPTRGGTT